MGGLYGKLLIAAYITFCTVMLGFIVMCVVFGRKGDTKIVKMKDNITMEKLRFEDLHLSKRNAESSC